MGASLSTKIFGGRRPINVEATGTDFYSPTVVILNGPPGFIGNPWEEGQVAGPMSKEGALQVQGEDGQQEMSCRAELKHMFLEFTIASRPKTVIEFSPFCVCQEAIDGDAKAEDSLTYLETGTDGMRTDFLVRGDSVFWIHIPEIFRTLYFRAASRNERDDWVSAINHNLEHIRCDPEHQKVITLLCKTTLEFHGFGVEEMQSKIRRVKQAYRMRYFEPWDVLPRGGLYAAVRAIETRKPRQLEALISNGRVSAGAALPASMGGHSLLIVVVLEGATECLNVLLNDDACDPDATNTAGDTALIIAARLGRIKTVAQLLAKGVDRTICNKFGEDAKSQSTAALGSIILTASVQAVLALSTGKVIPLKQARSLAILDMMKDGDDDDDAFGHNDEAHSWDLEDPFHPDVTFRPMRKNQECPFTPQGTNKMTFLKSQSCDEESDSKKIGKYMQGRRASLLDDVFGSSRRGSLIDITSGKSKHPSGRSMESFLAHKVAEIQNWNDGTAPTSVSSRSIPLVTTTQRTSRRELPDMAEDQQEQDEDVDAQGGGRTRKQEQGKVKAKAAVAPPPRAPNSANGETWKKVSTPEARSDGRSSPLRGNFAKTASSESIRADIVFDEDESNLADNTHGDQPIKSTLPLRQVEQPGNVNALPASLDLESGGVGKLYMPTYDASPEAPHSSIELRNVVPSISLGRLAGGSDEANAIPSSVEENVIERMKHLRSRISKLTGTRLTG